MLPEDDPQFRKQELGTNTNTWGDTKLNEVLDAIDQAMDGVESIALRGARHRFDATNAMQDNLMNQANVDVQANQMGLANAAALMDAGSTQFNQPLQAYQSLLAPYDLGRSTFGSTTVEKKKPGLIDWFRLAADAVAAGAKGSGG